MSTIGTLVRVEYILKAAVPIIPLAILLSAVVLFVFSKTSKEREKFKKISYIIFGIGIAFLTVGFLLSAGVTMILDNSNPAEKISTPPTLSDCEKKQDISDKYFCFATVARLKNDISLCENIPDVSQKDGCYFDVAVKDWDNYPVPIPEQNPAICEKIQNQTTENICEAILTKDSAKCASLQDNDISALCYADVGIARQDLSICDKAQGTSGIFKWTCYARVGVYKNDPSICQQINNPTYEPMFGGSCYEGIAEATKNLDLCEDSPGNKDICYYLARP